MGWKLGSECGRFELHAYLRDELQRVDVGVLHDETQAHTLAGELG